MTRQKVLQDHTRLGKTFIPPFTHMLGPLHEVSWVKTILPELLWIALIQNYYGDREGVTLITSLVRIARQCSCTGKRRIFATTSFFRELSTHEQSCLQSKLATSGELFEIQKALFPLIAFYPECPLRFLYSNKPNHCGEADQNLERLKTLVKEMYDKTIRSSMLVQATAIWLAFDSGTLKVSRGLTLASFPEIEKYPHTELSQKVAASIRSSIFMLFREAQYQVSSNWPKYFWNRGLQIDHCYFEEVSDE